MSELWMIPAMVGGMFCALVAQYLAARAMALFRVPLTRAVETGRGGDPPVIQHQRTSVSLAIDALAYLGGLVGGTFGIAYLIQWVCGR